MKKENQIEVALVEDDDTIRTLVQNELNQMKGVIVQVYTSAEECLQQFQPVGTALILLDFSLNATSRPKMNGHEALNHFRKRNTNQKIIFLANSKNRELLEVYKTYREVDFIEKDDIIMNQLLAKKLRHQLMAA